MKKCNITICPEHVEKTLRMINPLPYGDGPIGPALF
jgi:hypothetical protein